MAQSLLAIAQSDKTETIGLGLVLKHDFLWWIMGAGASILLFAGVFALTASVRPDMDTMDVGSILFTAGRPFYYALVVIGVLLARRSFDVWTWVLIGILVFGFMDQGSFSFSVVWMPHSILYTMIAMIGLLSLGRIIEYLHMRYIVKLDVPRLSVGGWAIYIALIAASILLNSSVFYDIIRS